MPGVKLVKINMSSFFPDQLKEGNTKTETFLHNPLIFAPDKDRHILYHVLVVYIQQKRTLKSLVMRGAVFDKLKGLKKMNRLVFD